MITDYSSIYIEGLLMDIKPIILPYDLKEYERGFPYEYEKVTPGPKPISQAELIEELDKIFEGIDTFLEERKQAKKLFFSKIDGKSTDMAIEFLDNLIL